MKRRFVTFSVILLLLTLGDISRGEPVLISIWALGVAVSLGYVLAQVDSALTTC